MVVDTVGRAFGGGAAPAHGRLAELLRPAIPGEVGRRFRIGGYRAIVQFDPDIEMFRGEFVGLNGGADFYARDVSGLRKEGAASLRVFLYSDVIL